MTKIIIDVKTDTDCLLEVSDISGFKTLTNVDGFLAETELTVTADNYKLSNGSFINVLLYNKFNTANLKVSTDVYETILSSAVDTVYSDNFEKTIYKLTADGSYTIKRFFIISKTYYLAHVSSGIFVGKTIVYVNNNILYRLVDSVETVYPIATFLNDNPSNFTGVSKSINFITTCFLNKCYFNLQKEILNSTISCKPYNAKNRDIVHMTLSVIDYLKQLNNSTEIQKIIEDLDACGSGICVSKDSDCGCS